MQLIFHFVFSQLSSLTGGKRDIDQMLK